MASPIDRNEIAPQLVALVGCETAANLLLYIFHQGEAHVRGASRGLNIASNSIQKQLEKFERAGVLSCRMVESTRVYSFNQQHPATTRLKDLLRMFYKGLTAEEHRRLFPPEPPRRGILPSFKQGRTAGSSALHRR